MVSSQNIAEPSPWVELFCTISPEFPVEEPEFNSINLSSTFKSVALMFVTVPVDVKLPVTVKLANVGESPLPRALMSTFVPFILICPWLSPSTDEETNPLAEIVTVFEATEVVIPAPSPSIVKASVLAYLNAINKIFQNPDLKTKKLPGI